MTDSRTQKFKKIHRFQQQQLDTIYQQIAIQQTRTDQVRLCVDHLQQQIALTEKQFQPFMDDLNLLNQSNLALAQLHQQLGLLQSELDTENQMLEQLRQRFRQQRQIVKSWDRLIEKEQQSQARLAQTLALRESDQRYLTTQFTGEPR